MRGSMIGAGALHDGRRARMSESNKRATPPRFPARVNGLAPVRLRALNSNAATTTATIKPAVQQLVAMSAHGGLGTQAACARMLQRLHEEGVADEAVLAAMRGVERHLFVDQALRAQAYEDTSLPIGLSQTISKPSVVARMIELLRQAPAGPHALVQGRVLEIGTGCGYQAAVLAQVCREVYSIERLRGLHDKARENLRSLRLPNVHLLLGDGMLGYGQGAPYAGIIAAAGGEAIPPAWIEQLAIGGRIVAPIATTSGQQALVIIDKTHTGIYQKQLEAVHFVPLKSGIV